MAWEYLHGEVMVHTAAETIVVSIPTESGLHQRTTLMGLGEEGWALITTGAWTVGQGLIHFSATFRRPARIDSSPDDKTA